MKENHRRLLEQGYRAIDTPEVLLRSGVEWTDAGGGQAGLGLEDKEHGPLAEANYLSDE